jgi:hypothetical protein
MTDAVCLIGSGFRLAEILFATDVVRLSEFSDI